jgi:hypothetical protein
LEVRVVAVPAPRPEGQNTPESGLSDLRLTVRSALVGETLRSCAWSYGEVAARDDKRRGRSAGGGDTQQPTAVTMDRVALLLDPVVEETHDGFLVAGRLLIGGSDRQKIVIARHGLMVS